MACEVAASPAFADALSLALEELRLRSGARACEALLSAYDVLCDRLSTMPGSGMRVYDGAGGTPMGALRWVPMGPYIAIYRRAGEVVILENLFHSRSDWRRTLGIQR